MVQSAVFPAKKPAVSTITSEWLTVVAAFLLIVGLPTAFWMLILELVAPLFGFDFGMAGRICVAVGLVTALAMIWALLCGADKFEADGQPEADYSSLPLTAGANTEAN